jgi:hypothetical protein
MMLPYQNKPNRSFPDKRNIKPENLCVLLPINNSYKYLCWLINIIALLVFIIVKGGAHLLAVKLHSSLRHFKVLKRALVAKCSKPLIEHFC